MKKKETHQIKLKTQRKQSSTTKPTNNLQHSHTRGRTVYTTKKNQQGNKSPQTFIAKFYYFNNLFFLGSYDIF
jgi:hypothetical protein